MNQRDTQFETFARLLVEELMQVKPNIGGRTENDVAHDLTNIVARRAYDLMAHTVGYSLEYLDECGREIPGSMNSRIMPSIPDMTKLPDEYVASKVEAFKKLSSPGVIFSDEQKAAIQMASALEPPRDYENFGRIITFSEGPEPPKEQE